MDLSEKPIIIVHDQSSRLMQGFTFVQGYTLFSTALSNLDIVGERFFLGLDYLDKFTVRATRDLIKNIKPQA